MLISKQLLLVLLTIKPLHSEQLTERIHLSSPAHWQFCCQSSPVKLGNVPMRYFLLCHEITEAVLSTALTLWKLGGQRGKEGRTGCSLALSRLLHWYLTKAMRCWLCWGTACNEYWALKPISSHIPDGLKQNSVDIMGRTNSFLLCDLETGLCVSVPVREIMEQSLL